MALFLSTYLNKVDKKGRTSVPAPFRATLTREPLAAETLVLFRSYKFPALEGCSLNRMQRLSESVETLDLFSDTQDDLSTAIFADAHELKIDGDGRIMLPEILCSHAGIDGKVAFVGRGGTFQLWNPGTFEEHQELVRQRARESGAKLQLIPPASKPGSPVS
ncbi:MAG: division/cell wall cluster transcriptional repressor MraZ [bacterium]|nr:division/cell wall cluster transcriptional repressor MraZ [bacterium]